MISLLPASSSEFGSNLVRVRKLSARAISREIEEISKLNDHGAFRRRTYRDAVPRLVSSRLVSSRKRRLPRERPRRYLGSIRRPTTTTLPLLCATLLSFLAPMEKRRCGSRLFLLAARIVSGYTHQVHRQAIPNRNGMGWGGGGEGKRERTSGLLIAHRYSRVT